MAAPEPRLLFVHAHPDDESSKGAATAARYADQGAQVTLVTCTGGEAGEVLNPACDPVPPERMAEVRARELADAAAAIGFSRVHRLGYVDSGWTEDLATVPTGTFWHVPLEDSAPRLAAIVRDERPHVVVTYPEDGGYPHPDHIRTHDITVAALALAADPDADVEGAPWHVPKLYATSGFHGERLRALHQTMLDAGLESPFTRWLDDRPERFEEPAPTTRVACGEWFSRRDEALRAHVTQIDPDGFFFSVPRELERRAYPYEAYDVLRSDVPIGDRETDLFAGLDLQRLEVTAGRVDAAEPS